MTSYLSVMMLYMIKKMNGERSVSAIYHMLCGKKSSQTIQDVHLFGLTNMFGIYATMTRPLFLRIIQELLEQKWIIKLNKQDTYKLTEAGNKYVAEQLKRWPIPAGLNGLKYQSASKAFWAKLNLFIQTLSHIIHNEPRFYPIERDVNIQQDIKRMLARDKRSREELARLLFAEVVSLLEQQSPLQQEVFVKKATGYRHIGQTYDQMAKFTQHDEWYIRLMFLATIHKMLQEIENNPSQYEILTKLVGERSNPLTESSRKTYQYLLSGRSISEIAAIRRLKENTIEDHVIEIVHTIANFPIKEYVTAEQERSIMEAIDVVKTKQLKALKERVADDTISFFQIRLVLAKVGNQD